MKTQSVSQLCRLIYGGLLGMDSPFIKDLESKNWAALAKRRVKPDHYDNELDFGKQYASQELLRKWPHFDLACDPKQVARDKFLQAESQCYRTNQRLYRYIYGTHAYDDIQLRCFIRAVKNTIFEIIGSRPKNPFEYGGFGPGSTFEKLRANLVADKLESLPTVTHRLTEFEPFSDFLRSAWAELHQRKYKVVQGSRFTSVPKDAQSERGINIEPLLNLYFQKGYGEQLRVRLKAHGIDLKDGQRRNGLMAAFAAKTGQYATIDLSSASDTVSESIVQLLLPKAWYEHLAACRSEFVQVDGQWRKLEKFSAMGNGYTFELETLIFAAIAVNATRVTCREAELGKHVLVYGDDIIVPSCSFENVLSVLKFFGFTPNTDKSFGTGYFRESCGTDAFGDLVIKPIRLDDEPTKPEHWIAIANGIRRLAFSLFGQLGPLRKAWLFSIEQLPTNLRSIRGPERLGDACIHDDVRFWQRRSWRSFKTPRSPDTSWLRVLSVKTVPVPWEHWTESVMLASRLYKPDDYSRGLTGRGCRLETGFVWVSVS